MRPNKATPEDKREGIVYRYPVTAKADMVVRKSGDWYANGVMDKNGKWVPHTNMTHNNLRDALHWADWQMNKMRVK